MIKGFVKKVVSGIGFIFCSVMFQLYYFNKNSVASEKSPNLREGWVMWKHQHLVNGVPGPGCSPNSLKGYHWGYGKKIK